jgi:hypothetical protein
MEKYKKKFKEKEIKNISKTVTEKYFLDLIKETLPQGVESFMNYIQGVWKARMVGRMAWLF